MKEIKTASRFLALILTIVIILAPLPIPTASAADFVESFICGDVTATVYDDDGVYILIVEGSGDMDFSGSSGLPPWLSKPYLSSVQEVIIEEGVTNIADMAFYNYYEVAPGMLDFTNLRNVTIAASVLDIGMSAFSSCPLESITFMGDTPPSVYPASSFIFIPSTGTIYCPNGAIDAYLSWKDTVQGIREPGWTVVGESGATQPTITGPDDMKVRVTTGPSNYYFGISLMKDYVNVSTSAFTISGSPDPEITISCVDDEDGKIVWNDTTKSLDIAAGLPEGEYTVEITADNDVGTAAKETFIVTVHGNAIPVNEPGLTSVTFSHWLIDGAEILSFDEKKVTDQGGGRYDRTYDILLAAGTAPDALISIRQLMTVTLADDPLLFRAETLIQMLPVSASPDSVVITPNPSFKTYALEGTTYGRWFNLSDEAITTSVTFDIHWRAAGTPISTWDVKTTHVFNFTIFYEDPDPSDVSSIAITTPPNKTQYFDGDRFSRAGMAVTATLKGGGTAPVSEYTITPEMLTLETTEVTVTFGEGANTFTATQPVTVLPSLGISNVAISNGQFMQDLDAVVLYGQTKANITFEVADGVEVYIGAANQTVTDGLCTILLDASRSGTPTVITLRTAGAGDADYTFRCYTQLYSGMPTRVVDYLVVASQYTDSSFYGLNPVATLRGENVLNTTFTSAEGMNVGPKSLGNFGGYITYYYDDPITDDPSNPYGVDFIVYGNSVDGSNAFAEPGNVLVSEDGVTWYTLAGSLHYDDYVLWNYEMTYTRNFNGWSAWSGSDGASGTGDKYPTPKYYPLHDWKEGEENQITLTGTYLLPESTLNEYGNTLPPYPHFGYADSGRIGDSDVAANPYLGVTYRNNRIYTDRTDGFDLKWAVDDNGQPVDLSATPIHYIKIQCANNINSGGGGIGEKSTEIHMVRRAAPGGSGDVGVTAVPSSISVNGAAVSLTPGQYVYSGVAVPESGAFIVSVDAPEGANVYINGARGTTNTFAKMPNHKMIRVIVQEGQKAPVIYHLNLVEDSGVEGVKYSEITFNAVGGSINGKPSDTMVFTAETADKTFPSPEYLNRSFLGWFDGDGNKFMEYYDGMPQELALTARWEYLLSAGQDPRPTVSFRLIGSTPAETDELGFGKVDLSQGESGYYGAEYVTWIGTKQYTMTAGDTVYDLFVKAMADAGLQSRDADRNYISMIKAPASLGGYELSEFTNGQFSGWMYTVNGVHVDRGLREWDLKPGDVVIWHYVNDYRYEISDWFDDSEFPSLATDSTFFNRWLDAPDIAGGSTGSLGGGTTPGNEVTIEDGKTPLANAPSNSVSAEIEATVKDGAAVAEAGADTVKELIAEAKTEDKTNVTISIIGTQGAGTIELDLIVETVKELAKNGMSLTVTTDKASIIFDSAALTAMAQGKADDEMVRIAVELLDAASSALTAEQKAAIGDGIAVDVAVCVGNTQIKNFGGTVWISVPFTPPTDMKPEDYDLLTAYYFDENGNIQEIKGASYNAETKAVYFETSHFSAFLVREWINPFGDVSKGWYYRAVRFTYGESLMNGTGEGAFSPDATLTRAMLVTILYRNEGQPSIGAAAPFSDVASGQWYSDAIAWASANGIVDGYGDGRFGPNDSITREQFATIMYRYAMGKGLASPGSAYASSFSDAGSVSGWAQEAMIWANAQGLINGRTATTLVPQGTATRAEAATILMRFIEGDH